MTTLHIQNTVHDFDSWKAVFDKYDRFRLDHGVRSYRICRQVSDPNEVTIDLELDSVADAERFSAALQKVWATPQSHEQLVAHGDPVILELVEATSMDRIH